MPDKVHDAKETFELSCKFFDLLRSESVEAKKMWVLQGKTIEEVKELIEKIQEKEGKDPEIIGVPQNLVFFKELGKKAESSLFYLAEGRRGFIKRYIRKLLPSTKIHLLGSSSPHDFCGYGKLVESIDTSSPFITAYLQKDFGIIDLKKYPKPTLLYDEVIEDHLTDQQYKLFFSNINFLKHKFFQT